MASVVLSPFPAATSAVARAAAIAFVKANVVGLSKLSDERAGMLGDAASALVERFSPDAPASIKNEAAIRVAGWMHAREPKPIQGFTVGGVRLDFRERFFAPDALRNSGARQLLTPWRVRRALPAEESS